jgi:hypothetical protein
MKTSKYIVIISLFTICFNFSLQAQDTVLNRNVSVEREYRPVIQDAGKINSVPKVLEPTVEKIPSKYSDFDLPFNADYKIHKLPAAELAPEKQKNEEMFARIGFGTYLNTLVDFAYPIIKKPDMQLDAIFNYLGTFDAKQMHSTTRAKIYFNKLLKTFDLNAGMSGGHEYFKYYGNNYNSLNNSLDLNQLAHDYTPLSYLEIHSNEVVNVLRSFDINTLASQPTDNTFWRFSSFVGIQSLITAKELRYKAEIHYNMFSSINGITENTIQTLAKFSIPHNKNRSGIDLEIDNMMYNSTTIPASSLWSNYSILILNPYYSFDRESWNVRLGLKSAFSAGHGNLVSPWADISAEWKPLPKVLSIYGGIIGGYDVNSLNKISYENPYLNSDIRVSDTYSPYNLFVGIKAKPLHNLLIDAYIDFSQLNNQYFFVNKGYLLINPSLSTSYSSIYTNHFDVIYSNASLFKVGIRATYNLPDFLDIELKGAYNGWNVSTETYAWNKPKYELELNSTIKIDKGLSLTANAYYEGGRYAKLINLAMPMNDKVDINIGGTYLFNKWLTLFAKVNNLINSQYQNFYGYDVQGINFMIGAEIKF